MKIKPLLMLVIIALTTFTACEKEKEEPKTLKGRSFTATTKADNITIDETLKFTTLSQGICTIRITETGNPMSQPIEVQFTYSYNHPNIELIIPKNELFDAIKFKGSIEGKKLSLYNEETGVLSIYTEN